MKMVRCTGSKAAAYQKFLTKEYQQNRKVGRSASKVKSNGLAKKDIKRAVKRRSVKRLAGPRYARARVQLTAFLQNALMVKQMDSIAIGDSSSVKRLSGPVYEKARVRLTALLKDTLMARQLDSIHITNRTRT